jgi:hypothetical protein
VTSPRYCAPCIADLALVREAVTSVTGTAACMAHAVLLTHSTDDPGRRRQRLDALKDLATGKAETAEPTEQVKLELLVQEYGLAGAMDMGGPPRRQPQGLTRDSRGRARPAARRGPQGPSRPGAAGPAARGEPGGLNGEGGQGGQGERQGPRGEQRDRGPRPPRGERRPGEGGSGPDAGAGAAGAGPGSGCRPADRRDGPRDARAGPRR